jgi:hypothetical protein
MKQVMCRWQATAEIPQLNARKMSNCGIPQFNEMRAISNRGNSSVEGKR